MARRTRTKYDAWPELWDRCRTLLSEDPFGQPSTIAERELDASLTRLGEMHLPIAAIDEIGDLIDTVCRIANERECTVRAADL